MNIYPSLISSDLLNLQKTLTTFDPHCQGYHLDVMDDHFVPNVTMGPAFINAIRTATKLPLHIHLMVENPEMWVVRLKLAPGDTLIFHYETRRSLAEQIIFIDTVRNRDLKVGIAINPNTPIEVLQSVLPLVDLVLVMTVYPGFSGQTFIPDVLTKISPLIKMQQNCASHATICLDGGINEHTIRLVHQHKIDNVAVATAIFGKPDPVAALRELYKLSGC